MTPPVRRVLMVTARFAPDVGGTETHVAEVSKRLQADGLSIEILTTDRTGRLAPEERYEGIRVRRLRAYPGGRDWYVAPALPRAVARSRADIVHVQGIHTAVFPLATIGALARDRRLVVTFHTGGHRSALRRRSRWLQWRILSPLLAGADALVAVSEYERAFVSRAARLDPSRVVVISNGAGLPVEAAREVEPDPDLVLSVGRLEHYKGHHRAVAALPALLRIRPASRLEIIGAGPEHEALVRQAAELGVADRVTIQSIPARDRAGMARVMASAGLVVLLSEYEAHPVAVMEALSLGRPVLVADTSGLHELGVTGQAAMIPLDARPEEVAAAIDSGLRNQRPRREGLISWDDCAADLLAVYQGTMASRPR